MSRTIPEGWVQLEAGRLEQNDTGIQIERVHTQLWVVRHKDGRQARTPTLKRMADAVAWVEAHPQPEWLAHGETSEPRPGAPAKVEDGKTASIYFDQRHIDALAAEERRTGLNRSEIMRRILDKHFFSID